MQLCYIHFYQKIARKKIARVNAALQRFHVLIADKQPTLFRKNKARKSLLYAFNPMCEF